MLIDLIQYLTLDATVNRFDCKIVENKYTTIMLIKTALQPTQHPTLHDFKSSPVGEWRNNTNRGEKHHYFQISELEVIPPTQSSLARAMNSLWCQLYFCDIISFKWLSKEGKGRNTLFWKHFESQKDTLLTLAHLKQTDKQKMTQTVRKGFKLQRSRKDWIFVLLCLVSPSFALSLVHLHSVKHLEKCNRWQKKKQKQKLKRVQNGLGLG